LLIWTPSKIYFIFQTVTNIKTDFQVSPKKVADEEILLRIPVELLADLVSGLKKICLKID
jgi:hypothetical protein